MPELFPPHPYSHLLSDETSYGDYRDALKSHGYAIIPDVLTSSQAMKYRGELLSWLAKRGDPTGLKLDDPETYTTDKLPVHIVGGMYYDYGLAQESFMWDLRAEPSVAKVFSTLYGTDELLCSHDAACVMLPGRKDYKSSPWPHCDQSPSRKGFYVLQSFVSLAENGKQDGGLMALKGSAELFEDYFDHFGREETRTFGPPDYFTFKEEELQWYYDRGCEWVKVDAGEPGSMVVWDSRTVHYSVLPTSTKERICIYVCMSPAHLSSEDDRAILAKAFSNGLRTTHITFGGHVFSRPHERAIRSETGKPDEGDDGRPLRAAKDVVAPDSRILKLAGVVPW